MAREILFRGKRFDDGAWVEGWYCEYPDSFWTMLPSIVPYDDAHVGCWHRVKVDPETVGQYTGMNDKNGMKIYEGDILHFRNAYNDNKWVCSVQFRDGAFVHQYPDGIYNHPTDWNELVTWKVIGNIHDNPELLDLEES